MGTYSRLYILKQEMPGFEEGTIFQHRDHDEDRELGSPGSGYLTNIWVDGDCQGGWAGETHILPGQLKDDRDWFQPIRYIGQKTRDEEYVVNGQVFRIVPNSHS